MPRKPTPPPYPKQPHKTGQARIKIRGKDHYLGLHGSPESYAEYRRLLAEWDQGPHLLPPLNGPLTVASLCVRFLTHAESYYRHPDGRPTSELESFRQSLRPLLALHRDTVADSFGPRQLKQVREAMIAGSWLTEEERTARPDHHLRWSRKLVNQRIGRIKRAFKWAASEELIPASVYEALRTVQGLQAGRTTAKDYPEIEPVADAVVQKTLPHLSPVIRAMVELQRLTGMRPGEVCSLTPAEIDQVGLKVDGVTIWVYRPGHHKTAWRGHAKAVAIGPKAQEVLRPFLDRPVDKPCFSPREADPRKAQTAGERYSVNTYGHRIRAVCERETIPPWHPHQLRHTAATAIGDLEQARAVLGHKDVKITALYAARDLRTAAAVAARIG